MTIGLPIPLAFQSSNVTDPVPTLKDLLSNCQAPVFDKGLEVRGGSWIYEYHGKYFIPATWTQAKADAGVYNVGDVLLKGCKLIKVTGKSGTGITEHKRPAEPEEYPCFDHDMAYRAWKCRYVRLPNNTKGGWNQKTWDYLDYQYTITWDAKAGEWKWTVRDTRKPSGCVTNSWTIKRSGKYTPTNDNMAASIIWAAAAPYTNGKPVVMRTLVDRGGYIYLRTSVNTPILYKNWSTGTAFKYTYSNVSTPADISGFREKRLVQAYSPFDGKNYTETDFNAGQDGFARWDVIASADIDSIALGHVICDTVDFVVSDQNGARLFELNNYPVDNSVSVDGSSEYYATVVLYTDKKYPAGSIITVFLNGASIKLGEMLGASKFDAGFTKPSFVNSFKDFSPKEQDQWGNWVYIDGVRVKVHKGVIEYDVVSYDRLNRLMMMIGGQKVVINSSDATNNEVPDGKKVFEATMMIGRFITLELSSKEKYKRIGERANYNFNIEELV